MLGNAVPPDLRAVFPQSHSGSPDGKVAPQPADASGQKQAAPSDGTGSKR